MPRLAAHTTQPLIIAHRGASTDAPENTMAAFQLAFEQGADGIELDIHLTRDGRIVVIHDANTNRTGGVDKKIADQTFEEIRQLNVGNFGQWTGKGYEEKIPTLGEVLAIVPDGKKIYIEIKVGPEILPALEEVLSGVPIEPELTAIITFSLETAAAAKERFPDRKIYWLVGKDENARYPAIEDVIAQAKTKVDGLDIDCQFSLDAATIQKIHSAGLTCNAWTVNDAATANVLIEMGIESITTDRAGALRTEIKKLHRPIV